MKFHKSRQNHKEPKLLVQVLQAVSDIKDSRGSTLRRIADQVQTAVKLSKVKPAPRNVFGQVRRALKHGVQTGVLKHRAGKFRLSTANEINQALKYGVISRGRQRNKRRATRKSPTRRRGRRRRVTVRRPRRPRNQTAALEPLPINRYVPYSNVADQERAAPEMDERLIVKAATAARRRRRRRTASSPIKRRGKSRRRRKSAVRRRKRPRNNENDVAMLDDGAFGAPATVNMMNRLQGRENDYSDRGMYMPQNDRQGCDNADYMCNMEQNMDPQCPNDGLYGPCNNCNSNNNYLH